MCAASLPTCNGETLTTCTAGGNGYASGGTACAAPMHCSSGACRTPFFIENFEDGDAIGWSPSTGTLGSSVVTNTTAAAGTTYSFDEGGAMLYRTLPQSCQPIALSAWARATDTQLATITFGGVASINFSAQVSFGPGYITLGGQKTLFSVPYQLNAWYHVELRNIDWQAQTFDVFINDGIVAANVTATSPFSPMSSIALNATGSFYWDEIAVYTTSTCTPNHPVCTGNMANVCNSDGSGYTSAGAACNGPNFACNLGKCASTALDATFEDGTTDGANPDTGTWTATVVTSTAAAGTAHSLELTGSSFFQGPYYPILNVQASHIGFWLMGVGGEFVVSSGTNANNNLLRITTYDPPTYPVDNAYQVLITDTAWHHFELRNIDWTARTFDIYVDGTLSASNAFPTNFGTSVGSIDFFNTATGMTTYWDEIDVTP
jgi:hypothetical protein